MQHNATQQCYMEILLEINPSATQHNRTVQQEDFKEKPQRNACAEYNATHQCYKEILLEKRPCATQRDATQQCNEKISGKYPRGAGATQCNTTVLQGNFTRTKPKCNTTQHNSATRKLQRNTLEEQVQHNTTQQCYMETLSEINPSAMQHNTTAQ